MVDLLWLEDDLRAQIKFMLIHSLDRIIITFISVKVVTNLKLSCAPAISQWSPGYTWKRPRGRPRHTWVRTVGYDLRPTSIDLHTAWRRAQNRSDWRTFL